MPELSGPDGLSDRVLTGPIARRHLSAHDGNPLRIQSVETVERSSPHDRNSENGEVARRRHLDIRQPIVARVLGELTLVRELSGDSVRAGLHSQRGHGCHAWKLLDSVNELFEELQARARLSVPG